MKSVADLLASALRLVALGGWHFVTFRIHPLSPTLKRSVIAKRDLEKPWRK